MSIVSRWCVTHPSLPFQTDDFNLAIEMKLPHKPEAEMEME